MDLAPFSRACVHCGVCLPACPTYEILREEADSPRGRVLLLEALATGRAEAADVRPYIDRCIGCRACETACPSGVPYGALLEQGRARLGGPRPIARFFLRHVVGRPRLMAALAMLGRRTRRFPPRAVPTPWPEAPEQPRGRVALHLGCITPHVYPSLARDAARLLTRLGYQVDLPRGQGCCGALHRHAGLDDAALREQNVRAFHGYDTVLTPAAGCATTPALTDLSRFLLDELPLQGLKLPHLKLAYDAPCHLLHGQGVDASPLLDAIEGVQRVPLEGADRCCGAGGLYMEQQTRLARAVRARKLDAIVASGAQAVAVPNPGCMIWLWRGLRERRLPIDVVHPVSLLARASA